VNVPLRALLLFVAAAALLAACERERRDLHTPPSAAVAIKSLRMSDIVPGAADTAPPLANPDENNAYATSEGKRLFNWYNCNGCHADGGGDKGPALTDDVWSYGSEPANISPPSCRAVPTACRRSVDAFPRTRCGNSSPTCVRSADRLAKRSRRAATMRCNRSRPRIDCRSRHR
jgi:hypothetical protein